MDKSPALATYFDQWGGRCYLFASELGEHCDFKKDTTKKINHLALNRDAFKALGGNYIFSGVEIVNAGEYGLQFKKVFDDPDSAWGIYLFEAK